MLEGDVVTATVDAGRGDETLARLPWRCNEPAAPASPCAVSGLDRRALRLHAAARVTGAFAVAANAEHAAARRDALQECARLDAEIARLRARRERKQMLNRRVELNLELKRVEAAQAAARANL